MGTMVSFRVESVELRNDSLLPSMDASEGLGECLGVEASERPDGEAARLRRGKRPSAGSSC